jgi:HlyD family secretion protein
MAMASFIAASARIAGRLRYLAEIDLEDAADLPSGIPVRAVAPDDPSGGNDG